MPTIRPLSTHTCPTHHAMPCRHMSERHHESILFITHRLDITPPNRTERAHYRTSRQPISRHDGTTPNSATYHDSTGQSAALTDRPYRYNSIPHPSTRHAFSLPVKTPHVRRTYTSHLLPYRPTSPTRHHSSHDRPTSPHISRPLISTLRTAPNRAPLNPLLIDSPKRIIAFHSQTPSTCLAKTLPVSSHTDSPNPHQSSHDRPTNLTLTQQVPTP